MAVKIRLTRKGKKKQPTYRVVVADARSPRDGRYIEQIGRYDPRQEPSIVEIDNERASYWLGQGAQPSDAVRKLLEISGALAARAAKPSKKVHVVGEDAQLAAEEEAAEIEAAAARTTEAMVETPDAVEVSEAPVEPPPAVDPPAAVEATVPAEVTVSAEPTADVMAVDDEAGAEDDEQTKEAGDEG